MNTPSIDDQIAAVVRRLTPVVTLPEAAVEHEVRLAFEQWTNATIRDFVPILVERQVRGRLGAAAT